MSQRRHAGEWVFIALPGSPTPRAALLQPSPATEPCFDCEDGACQAWTARVSQPTGASVIRTVSECGMQSVPKSFTAPI